MLRVKCSLQTQMWKSVENMDIVPAADLGGPSNSQVERHEIFYGTASLHSTASCQNCSSQSVSVSEEAQDATRARSWTVATRFTVVQYV